MLFKFESEVNDIYKLLFKDESYQFTLSDNFLGAHRNRLFKDQDQKTNLVKCYEFLQSQKEVFMNFNRTLRNDLKKVKQKIEELERLEEDLLEEV